MKIWFDISNSPHINMFEYMIGDLASNGHEIIVTSRPLANTIDLLNQKKIQHTIIGSHYGKNIFKKVLGYPIRVFQLYKFLNKAKPNLAVSQSSFHSPLVAWLLNVPSVYTNDNEHAFGNKIAFAFASKILIPESVSLDNMIHKRFHHKVIKYPGLKEGVYLWTKSAVINKVDIQKNTFNIYIRPEPQTAAYYNGKTNFLDNLIVSLQEKYHITVLTRNNDQFHYYKQKKFYNIYVPDKPLLFDDVINDCNVFIGAGGSMTRELAILGIPTISVYQDNLLDVDRYLLDKKLMKYDPNLDEDKLIDFIHSFDLKSPAESLLKKGKIAYQLFIDEIIKYIKHD